MKRQDFLAAGMGALMLMPSLAMAQTTPSSGSAAPSTAMPSTAMPGMTMPQMSMGAQSATVSDDDKTFVIKAAQGGKTEVASSRLALKTSQNVDVKDFAQQMVDDHGKADRKLMALAKADGITVPKGLDTEHKSMVNSLKSQTGGAFDTAYITMMAKGHEDALTVFQREADHGTNPDLKAFAAATVPTIQHHQDLLKALQAKVVAGTSAAQ